MAVTRFRSPSGRFVTLREKIQELEAKFSELVSLTGSENEPDRRKIAPFHAGALRCARSRDDARGALPQPQGRFRRAAVAARAVGQGAGAVVPARARCDVAQRSADYADRISAALLRPGRRRSSRANGSMIGDGSIVIRVTCRSRTAQTFGVLALGSPDPQPLPSGDGHAVSRSRLAELASVSATRAFCRRCRSARRAEAAGAPAVSAINDVNAELYHAFVQSPGGARLRTLAKPTVRDVGQLLALRRRHRRRSSRAAQISRILAHAARRRPVGTQPRRGCSRRWRAFFAS